MSARPVLVFPLILGITLLAGCGGHARVPQDHYYRLHLAEPVRMKQPVLSGTLAVKRFAADGMLQDRSIVYSRPGKPLEAESYHYHHWTDIPPVMLQQLLVDYLRAANAVTLVTMADADIRPDYILNGRVRRIERSIGASSAIFGVIELDLGLIHTDSGRVLFNRTYRQDVKADGDTVADTVTALNKALANAYAEFLNDLKAFH